MLAFPSITIVKDNIRIVCIHNGINIFWNDYKLTVEPGLNVAINTLGLWNDSTKADWYIEESKDNFFKIRLVFRYLPLEQIWTVSMINPQTINWNVDAILNEGLHIDEFRILSMIDPQYKAWFVDYKLDYFPALDNKWRDLYINNSLASLIGATFSVTDKLPSFILETKDKSMLPIIQNPPLDLNAHIIGFRNIESQEKRYYTPGKYLFFSGRIELSNKTVLLDRKAEKLRQSYLSSIKKRQRLKFGQKRKLKVLLANLPWNNIEGSVGVRAGSRWPHIKDESEGDYLPFPFFLAYATSLLRKNGIDADLIDAIAEGYSLSEFIKILSKRDFDLLVVETSVPSFYYDLKLIEKISSLESMIVLCGPHSEIYDERFLAKYNFVDFVLFGEYEFTLLELVKVLEDGKDNFSMIKGLIWRDKRDRIVKNPPRPLHDIDLLPWPYRETLRMEKYCDTPGNMPMPSVQMVASRGCPFLCSFCLWPQILFGGRTYRVRNIYDVINEMEYLVKDRGFKSVYFDDDTFNLGRDRMLKFCSEIIRRRLHKIPWAIMAKPDLMDEEILETMKKAGLYAVKYGIESASQELLNNCNKTLDLEKTERVVKVTKSLDIRTHLTFTFGLPGETKETIKKTIDYAINLDPESIQFSIITPFPGTSLFRELEREGKIITRDWSLYDGHHKCVFKPDNLTPAELEYAKQYAYRVWADHKRKTRGFIGDVKRFFDYWREYGAKRTFVKTHSYLNYILFHRKRFIGKL